MKNTNLYSSVNFFPGLDLAFFKIVPLFCLFFMISAASSFCAEESAGTIQQEAGFYYTVKKGDTLWDLSQRFGDSPWLWPDLWKENSQIPNPHWIYPGNRIRLFRKEWVQAIETEGKTTAPEPIYYSYKDIDMVGFIKKEPVMPSAVIFKVKGDKKMISAGDLVYLRKEAGSDFMPGRRYTVYRTLNPIKNEKTGEYIGIQHYLTGIVEVLKDETEFVLGQVAQSFRPIYIEDKLMPYVQRKSEIPVLKSTQGILGGVIGPEENQKIFGDHTIAFIDKGANDGIKIGQCYQLFTQEKAMMRSKPREEVMLTPIDAGSVFVLHTEDTTSTVVVTSSKELLTAETQIRSELN